MNKLQVWLERVRNDEEPVAFDYEPRDLTLIEADEDPPADIGDADSQKAPPP